MKEIKCKYCGKLPRPYSPALNNRGGFKYGVDICADCFFKLKEKK
jgi:hypothetical protein